MELEKRGTPTICICTTAFELLAKAESKALGMPQLAFLFLPHPIGGISPDEVVQKADNATGEMITLVTMS